MITYSVKVENKSTIDGEKQGGGGYYTVTWDAILNKPTTVSGFGITDVYTDDEVDTLLLTKEPAFSKGSAFNKNFGTTAGTVSEGDHNHSGVYEPADSHITKDNVAEVIYSEWNFTNKLGIGVSAPNEELEVSAGTAFGEIAIYKNSSSVDAIGRYSFIGKDSSSNLTKYAAIKGEILTNTDGSEKGALNIEVMNGSGVLTTVAQFNGYNLSLTSGTITASNFIDSSDRRLKHSIKDASTKGHSKIRVVEYRLNKEPERLNIGAIADEVQKIYPDFVYEDANGYLAIDYRNLAMINLKRVQELESLLSPILKIAEFIKKIRFWIKYLF